ncbi:hypothetical protein Scep_012796 [Stephania cephalantha]|uniref:Uncharacterized protein n=1 Tax=Stephania cephalantha TaxID=152367 RepID=A0AAP0P711_9MAGN
MAFYSGTIKYMDVVEPYHPERILRQFGHVQSIPDPPYRPLEAHRGPFANKYSVKYGFQQDNWERWRNHLLAPEVRGDKAEFEFLATPDYLPWFLKVSHPVITYPSLEDHDMVATTIAQTTSYLRYFNGYMYYACLIHPDMFYINTNPIISSA